MGKHKKQPGDFKFDFSSLDFSGPEDEVSEIGRVYTGPVEFDNAEKMADYIDYSRDYFAIVKGSFIFGDFIEALCYKKQLHPTAIYLTTLGMSKENADSLVNLVDYLHCEKLNLVVSSYFYAVERAKIMRYMTQEFSGKPIDIAVLRSHCKIALILAPEGNTLISGSANLSSSSNLEQFVLMHDSAAVDWTRRKLDDIMTRFSVFRGAESIYTPEKGEK